MKKNELDDYRSRQAIEKEAELQAKLEKVELRDRPKYGRPPRKIGEMACGTGIKNGSREERATFTLRLEMKREVDSDGNAATEQTSVARIPSGLVPYTATRAALLSSIRDAFRSIDAKMVELLGGSPEEVAKRLDSATGPLLLAAPPPKKAKAK